MSGNIFGEIFKVATFGESHGAGLGCIIDGCPAGISVDEKFLQHEMERRKPGAKSAAVTARKEDDLAEILSGVFEGKTTGTPIAILIRNSNQHSSDYENINKIDEFILSNEKKGKSVYILDAAAAMYMIPLNKYNKDYDMLMQGNFGSKRRRWHN